MRAGDDVGRRLRHRLRLRPEREPEVERYATAYSSGKLAQFGANTWAVNSAAVPVTPTMAGGATTPVTVTNSGVTYTATLSYTANVPISFGGILGFGSMPISGKATASTTTVTYIRYYILVDVSQSMGVADTVGDEQKLYTAVMNTPNMASEGEPGCAFACHVPMQANSNIIQPETNEALARANGVTLRIDSAIVAIQSMITAAEGDQNATTPNISIGIYTMSNYGASITNTNNISQIAAPTYNLSSLPALVSTIDLGNNNSSGVGDSNFNNTSPNQFSAFVAASNIKSQGTGASPSSPINYVFLITDGLSDTTGCYYHCTGALNPAQCQKYLWPVANVGVIYTIYNPIYINPYNTSLGTESNYNLFVAPYVSQIQPNLQACSTSIQLFYPASDQSQIVAGMNTIFQNSQKAQRLTQ
jgi:hypothetical protein